MADAVPLRSNSKLLKGKLGTLPEVADAFVNTKQDLANAGCVDAAQRAPAGNASSVLAASLPAEYADPEEAALWHDFQQKLSQLRKLKVQRLVASPQAAAHPEGHGASDGSLKVEGTLAIHRASDGSLQLEDTSDLHCVPASDSACHSVPLASSESPKAKDEPIGLADLDPYTRAAMDALEQRGRKRKTDKVQQRPASCVGAVASESSAKVIKV